MKLVRSLARWGIVAGFALTLSAAPVKIEFSGVDASDGTVRLSLTHSEFKHSAWVRVGESFANCEVRAYDAKKQKVTLARGTETWEIALATASIGSATLTPEERERISKQVLNNLRQLAAASDQYFLENGTNTVRIDQLVGTEQNKYIKELKPVDGEDYAKINLTQPGPAQPPEWAITTSRGVTVRYTR